MERCPVPWLHNPQPPRGKEPGPGRPRSGSTSPFPITFASTWNRKDAVYWLVLSILSCSSSLRGAPCSYTSRKGLTGSAWRPATTEAHCSPAGSLPLIQEDPLGSPFKRARLVSPGLRPACREGKHRKRKLVSKGWGTDVTAMSLGVSKEGGAEVCHPWGEAALPHSSHLEARGV